MKTFLVGDRKRVKVVLGIPYGYIVVEGIMPVYVPTMARGRRDLAELVKAEVITGDEAAGFETQMKTAHLFEDWTAVKAHIATYTPPKDFVPSYGFKMCECGYPNPHGYIIKISTGGNGTEEQEIDGVNCLTSGFDIIEKAQGEGTIDIVNSAIVLSQMARAEKLSLDSVDMNASIEAMPQEDRRLLGPLTMTFEPLPGGGGVMAKTIPTGSGIENFLNRLFGRGTRRDEPKA